MVDFEWYRSFVGIYQMGTVSAAAERRGMTQPAISQHLAALEHALQTVLFQRTPRQMVPTPDGQSLYTRVIAAVEQLEQLSQTKMTHHKQTIRLGTPREYFYAQGLAPLTEVATETYQLQVVFGQTLDLIALLEQNELDVVITTQHLNRRLVHYVPLHMEEFILIGSSNLSLPPDMAVDALEGWLEQQPWIAYAPDLPIIRRYWQDVFSRRPTITPSLIVPDLLTILHAVTLGIGISVLPAYLCNEALANGQARILWQPERNPVNQLYVAHMRDKLQSAPIQWVYQTLGLNA